MSNAQNCPGDKVIIVGTTNELHKIPVPVRDRLAKTVEVAAPTSDFQDQSEGRQPQGYHAQREARDIGIINGYAQPYTTQ